jgi:hypothetical protein
MVRFVRRFPGAVFVMPRDWSVGDKAWIWTHLEVLALVSSADEDEIPAKWRNKLFEKSHIKALSVDHFHSME